MVPPYGEKLQFGDTLGFSLLSYSPNDDDSSQSQENLLLKFLQADKSPSFIRNI